MMEPLLKLVDEYANIYRGQTRLLDVYYTPETSPNSTTHEDYTHMEGRSDSEYIRRQIQMEYAQLLNTYLVSWVYIEILFQLQ